jgi:hypothetical protein
MPKRMMFAATMVLLVACGSPPEAASARARPAPQQFSSVDQLLAPIALYPDQLLAQILMSAADPAAVGQLDRWLKTNQNLKGSQLQDAALKAGFEPSFVALAVFPQVVAKMAADVEWTTLLGQAFAADRSAVFASIQRLRHQAHDVGTLKTTPQQEVTTKTTSAGQDVIVIEPANPQVVYVPQYNPTVVYTTAPTTTVVVENSSADAAVAAGVIGFTAGIAIGAAINNNYYYGPYGWRGGAYMYNDAWDDYYDAREDAREDWMDHREDLAEERGDVARDRQEQRTDRAQTSQEQRTDRRESTQQQRTDRQQNRQENPASSQRSTQAQSAPRSTQAQTATSGTQRSRTGSAEARGYGSGSGAQSAGQRSAGSSDAFSGYSSGKSQRSSSARGNASRSSSRGGGGRRR